MQLSVLEMDMHVTLVCGQVSSTVCFFCAEVVFVITCIPLFARHIVLTIFKKHSRRNLTTMNSHANNKDLSHVTSASCGNLD